MKKEKDFKISYSRPEVSCPLFVCNPVVKFGKSLAMFFNWRAVKTMWEKESNKKEKFSVYIKVGTVYVHLLMYCTVCIELYSLYGTIESVLYCATCGVLYNVYCMENCTIVTVRNSLYCNVQFAL